MKKNILFFLLFLCTVCINAQVNINNSNITDFLFTKYDIKTENVHLWINSKNSRNQLAGIIFNRDGSIKLYVGTSGYYVSLSDIKINNSFLEVSFVRIWVGAEFANQVDTRKINKYNLIIDKKTIEENYNWVIDIFDISQVFKAEDANNSVKYYNTFFVKIRTDMKTEMSECSESIGILTPENNFEILDVNCSELSKDDLWIKIKFNDTVGYIPFTSLGENWTVIENNL